METSRSEQGAGVVAGQLRAPIAPLAHRVHPVEVVAARLVGAWTAVVWRCTRLRGLRLVQPVRTVLPPVVLRLARRELPRIEAVQLFDHVGAGRPADRRAAGSDCRHHVPEPKKEKERLTMPKKAKKTSHDGTCKKLTRGDGATWNSYGGTAEGGGERKITRRAKGAVRIADASREAPRYEARSARSRRSAVHEPPTLPRK